MIVFALGAVFVICCLLWGATWIIQIGAVLVVLLFRLAVMLVQACGILLGSIVWLGWWLRSPKTAMASYRQEKGRRRAGRPDDDPSPYGDKPFHRRRAGLNAEKNDV